MGRSAKANRLRLRVFLFDFDYYIHPSRELEFNHVPTGRLKQAGTIYLFNSHEGGTHWDLIKMRNGNADGFGIDFTGEGLGVFCGFMNYDARLAFIQGIGGPELLIILVIILLLFGAKKLPELAKGLGKSMKEFKKATQEVQDDFKEAMDSVEEDKPAPKPSAPASEVKKDQSSSKPTSGK